MSVVKLHQLRSSGLHDISTSLTSLCSLCSSSCRARFLKELKELAGKRRQILASKSLSEDEKNTRLQELMLRNPLGSGPPLSIEDLGYCTSTLQSDL